MIRCHEKLLRFIEMCDSDIATLGFREIALAKAYFDAGQKFPFFNKIQARKPDLFQIIRGMAWDLWHLRQQEQAMTSTPSRGARYFFPAFLTCDKRLLSVISLYPLKAVAHIRGTSEPIPFYDGDWSELLVDDQLGRQALIARFFSESAVLSRTSRREEAKTHLDSAVRELEERASAAAKVAIPE